MATRKIKTSRGKYDKTFDYFTKEGKPITDTKTIEYIKSLKIPPAYSDVYINLNKNAKIRAYGYDDKGRKQYLYNPAFVKKQEAAKYCLMYKFGKIVPKIKTDVSNILNTSKDNREIMIAIIVRLIMLCNFRVGNESCKKAYNSYGSTTLQKRHIIINGSTVEIDFIGKKGVRNVCQITDKQTINKLKDIHRKVENKNSRLFAYDDGKIITSYDINDFIGKYGPFTSKDFRTWVANEYFFKGLLSMSKTDNESEKLRKKNTSELVKKIANKLHHTPAVCRKKYIDSRLIDIYIYEPQKIITILNNSNNPTDAFMKYLKSIGCTDK